MLILCCHLPKTENAGCFLFVIKGDQQLFIDITEWVAPNWDFPLYVIERTKNGVSLS